MQMQEPPGDNPGRAKDKGNKSNANVQASDDSPSRSNSIQGRKLSYCDPKITVS
jgi:hypothetical protein